MDWLGNNVKTFKVKGITIIANRNNGMVIGLDREGEEVVDLLKSNLIEISSLSDNQKELYKVLEENDFLKSCYKEIKGIDSVYLHVNGEVFGKMFVEKLRGVFHFFLKKEVLRSAHRSLTADEQKQIPNEDRQIFFM